MFKFTGKQLIREAMVDWVAFSDGTPFYEWFPEAHWIRPRTRYRCYSDLSGIEEID